MKNFNWKNTYFIYLLISMLWACGSSGEVSNPPIPTDEGKNRTIILTHLADNIIIPAYANFKVKFDLMKIKSDAFAFQPSLISLSEFRTAWSEAYIEWQKVELFDFGPAEKQTLHSFYNIYPASEKGINDNIIYPNANLEVPASNAQQGFPALDYLINGVGKSDAEILAYYTTATDATKRIAYLGRLTIRMESLLGKVISDWNGAYRETFISKTSLDPSAPTDR